VFIDDFFIKCSVYCTQNDSLNVYYECNFFITEMSIMHRPKNNYLNYKHIFLPTKQVVFSYSFYLLLYATNVYSNIYPPIHKLISNGTALAVIQHNNYTETAKIFQKYVAKSTGINIPLQCKAKSLSKQHQEYIHLTIEKKDPHQLTARSFKDADGFHMNFSHPNHIWIKGYSEAGLENAVYEFLERFVGIRWLFPGTLGEHIPDNQEIIVQSFDINQYPSFAVRHLSGLNNSIALEWARKNRMGNKIRLSHNLHNIFPIQTYLKTHPHIYPKKDGKPSIPYKHVGWQPCFQKKETIDIAVNYINEFFLNTRNNNTFSLSTNDAYTATSGFCDSDINGDNYNSWGYPNASNSYYQWANTVANNVLEKYPNKLFGTLAYMEVASAPENFKLNDHIITFLTEDRLRWIKDSYQLESKQWLDDWTKQAKNIGFYDYFYGTPYVLPRVYFHHMARIYRYAHSKGVIAVCAEAYPNWGEGPKLYLALKIFWDPYLKIDDLLNNWYTCCVGKKAAKYLRKYFSMWESFWMKTDNTTWFYNKSMYMAFWSSSYLDYAKLSDIQESRYLLEKTLANAQTPIQKKRAQLYLDTFEYYEASAISYWGLVANKFNINKEFAKEMKKKRYILMQKFEKDPLLHHIIRFDKGNSFPELTW